MEHAELVKRLEGMVERVGLDKFAITDALLKELTAKELRPVVEIMAPHFIDKYVRTPSMPHTGRKIVRTTRDLEASFPPGMSQNPTRSEIVRKAPHLAGWLETLDNQGNETFTRFGQEFTYVTMTPADLDWIGEAYHGQGNALLAISDDYFGIARDLRNRKVTSLGELKDRPTVWAHFIERMNKVREKEAVLSLVA